MTKINFVNVVKKEFVNADEIVDLSRDEKEILELLNSMEYAFGIEIAYFPKAYRGQKDIDGAEDFYSYITFDLITDFQVAVYFRNGNYHSWMFQNRIDNLKSGEKDKGNKQKAKEKIQYILEQYRPYAEARYQICKFSDDVYF